MEEIRSYFWKQYFNLFLTAFLGYIQLKPNTRGILGLLLKDFI